jgi:hypothetical protein
MRRLPAFSRRFLRGSGAIDVARRLPEERRRFVMMRVPLMLSALFALTTLSASGGEQLKIVVSPTQSFAPSNLSIRARVVPNAENRALEVIAESGEFYRSSQITLEGERAPSTITIDFRGVPSGEYQIYGILVDAGGHRRAMAAQFVRVLESGLGN